MTPADGERHERHLRRSGPSTTTSAASGAPPTGSRPSTTSTPPAARSRRWCRSPAPGEIGAAAEAARAAQPGWRAVPPQQRARAVLALRDGAGATPVRADRAGHRRHGQDPRRRRRRGRPRHRVGRVGGRDPAPAEGRDARGRRRRRRRRDGAPAGRRRRRDHPVQLPGDDPALVPALRDRLRQHLHPQALRAGPAAVGADRRDRRLGRGDPGRRRQPRPRRPRCGHGDPRGARDRRRLLRRPRGDRADHRPGRRRGPASACRRSAGRRTRSS